MALEAKLFPRLFIIEGDNIELKDPNPDMDIEQIKLHYSSLYPQITIGQIRGPSIKKNHMVYTFTIKIGTKG